MCHNNNSKVIVEVPVYCSPVVRSLAVNYSLRELHTTRCRSIMGMLLVCAKAQGKGDTACDLVTPRKITLSVREKLCQNAMYIV